MSEAPETMATAEEVEAYRRGESQRLRPPALDYDGRTFFFPWRGLIRPLSEAELGRLRESIRERGVRVPVVLDEADNVIDGDNRLHVARELGIPLADVPLSVMAGRAEPQKADMAIALNIDRRQLDPQELECLANQRRERVRLLRESGNSLRAIASETGVSHKTIRDDLAKLNRADPIEAPETVIGLDGKRQPATKEAKTVCPAWVERAAIRCALDGISQRQASIDAGKPASTFRELLGRFGDHISEAIKEEEQRRRHARDRPARPVYNRQDRVVYVGNASIRLGDLLNELAVAAGPEMPMLVHTEEYLIVRLRLSRDEYAALQESARKAELSDSEVTRKALRALGLI